MITTRLKSITGTTVQIDVTEASEETVQINVESALDQLLRYSRTIRRSGRLRRVAKATGYIDFDDRGNNLNAKVRESTEAYLTKVVGNTSDVLRARLLETILIRQQSFAFQRSRRTGGVRSSIEVPIKDTGYGPGTLPVLSVTKSEGSKGTRSRSSSATSSMIRKSGFSPSAATTYMSKSAPPAETHTRTPHMTFPLEDLPRRPKVPEDKHKKEQECPYCFVMCPVEEFTGSSWSYV